MTSTLPRAFRPTHFRNATWATYLRCHDDIGWAVTDEDAAALGLRDRAHRRFLADFYEGVFPAPSPAARCSSPTRTPATSARAARPPRSAGSRPRPRRTTAGIETAIHRILHGPRADRAFGGMPLIYMGDEIGLVNDRTYLDDPAQGP